jgi:hypothetical protein
LTIQLVKQLHVPVIVEGAMDHWAALSEWQDRTWFNRMFGHIPIRKHSMINHTLDTAQDGTNWSPDSVSRMGDYLAALEVDSAPLLFDSPSELMPLLFADRGGDDLQGDDLQGDDLHGDDLQGDDLQGVLPPRLGLNGWQRRTLSIGGNGKGLPPHKHSASWLGVIVGRKKWTLIPPNGLARDASLYLSTAMLDAAQWSESLKAKLRSDAGMVECVQRPGEVVIVPSQWWHATENFGDVVAVGASGNGLDDLPIADLEARVDCALTFSARANRLPRGDPMQLELLAFAMKLEPMSVHHILAYSTALLWTKPRAVLELIQSKVETTLKQMKQGNIKKAHARQLIGRLGSWLDKLPENNEAADAAIAAIRDAKKVEEFQANHVQLVDRIQRIYNGLS